jgi:hypothetical protein
MNLVPAGLAADDIACRIAAMPMGTRVEVRLKSNETLRGSMGLSRVLVSPFLIQKRARIRWRSAR